MLTCGISTNPFNAVVADLDTWLVIYNIDETADIFELDVTHRVKATQLGAGARYALYTSVAR